MPVVAKLEESRSMSHSSPLYASASLTSMEEAASPEALDVDTSASPTSSDRDRQSNHDASSSSSPSSASSPSLLTRNDLSAVRIERMSNIFLPYLNSYPDKGGEDDDSKNFRLLRDNGFMFPSQQGMYHLLPLGVRVMDKLKRIIVEELEDVGCQEMSMSSLTRSQLWEVSGRWENAGKELYRLTDRRDNQLCLAPTCEENVTDMMAKVRSNISHHYLPIKLFQITTKYRDEINATNGLLRGREFMMKDLYTFDIDVPSSEITYSIISDAYFRIFSRLSLPVYRVAGSPGKIGGSLSHEFQLPSPAGEDDIIVCENCKTGVNEELLKDEEERATWSCGCDKPKILRTPAIELGHTFLLGLKYTTPFNATYRSDKNSESLSHMGCYGIGVSRLIGACAEVSEPVKSPKSDVELVWPRLIAPYSIGILPPKKGSKEETPEVVDAFVRVTFKLSEIMSSTYSTTSSKSDVLVDDRTELTIGRRLVDLKRVGVPLILVVGPKFHKTGKFELIEVFKGQTHFLEWSDLLEYFGKLNR